MAEEAKIVRLVEEEIAGEDIGPRLGEWYWVRSKDYKGKIRKRFACIIEIGTNYYELEAPSGTTWRIHIDNFFRVCKPVKNPKKVISKSINKYKRRVQALMAEVQEITRRLGVAPHDQLAEAAPETQALATISGNQDFGGYSSSLVKAKDKDLPELFRQIRDANESMATWMKADIIPLQATVGDLREIIEKIEDRIFSVELYAGLTEQVIKVADGEPAQMGDKLHLMQRRLYMDEECLAHYRAGGMDWNNLGEFDAWLAEPENRDRILPFPRCMVSFQVRRYTKQRRARNLSDFWSIWNLEQADKATFLYVRNGEKIYCIATSLDLGEKLFPDFDKQMIGEPMMARMRGRSVDKLITKREYDAMVEHDEAIKAQWEIDKKSIPKKDWFHKSPEFKLKLRFDNYEPFDDSSVYYDEMTKKLAKEIRHYNRIALIIQGLFDRSPILHPHPPVKTWTQEGFERAVELVYDQDKALHPDEKPDIEAYMAELNAQIEEGSFVIGQRDFWRRKEGEKETNRRVRSWRYKSDECEVEFYEPYGNPGPKYIAQIENIGPRSKRAQFTWMRERLHRRYSYESDEIETKIEVPLSKLFNVSAYKPGDFKRFFQDPRTRSEYLEWAPFLIAAEEFHAGNVDPETGRKRKKEKKASKKKRKKKKKKSA